MATKTKSKAKGGSSKSSAKKNLDVQPLDDRIVVKPLEVTEGIRGGLIIPDTAQEKPQEADVLAVGPGRKTDNGDRLPMPLKVGDRVLYSKYGGTEIRLDGDDYLIVREDEVLGIIG